MKNYLLPLLLLLVIASCQRHNIQEQKQWSTIFRKYGIDSICFELADNSHEQVYYYNLGRLSTRYCPASTFKIMNSLIALETGVATDEAMVIPWDSVVRPRAEWNHAMSMREAFKVSCVPYYQEIARRIGKTDMQKWLDSVHYGNQSIGHTIDAFWLNDTLRISADEQVGLMKKLYFDKLPFSQRTHRIVRSMMLHEDSSAYRLYYKTGTRMNDSKTLAWIVGFVERKETQKGVLTKQVETNYKPYFFAMNFEALHPADDNYMATCLAILKEVLREKHVLP